MRKIFGIILMCLIFFPTSILFSAELLQQPSSVPVAQPANDTAKQPGSEPATQPANNQAAQPAIDTVKQPNVSGTFYPADPDTLSIQIDNYMNKADAVSIDGDIIALISPHAGYVYSGPVAAYGYKAIQSRNYSTVVILAPSHFVEFDNASIWPKGSFKTPLGEVAVDEALALELMSKTKKIQSIPYAFEREHSLEVQLPFLQRALGNKFKIVPIIMSMAGIDDCKDIAAALNAVIGERKDVLVVASTDMSHYYPYDKACSLDSNTISYIKNLDYQGLFENSKVRSVELCGMIPVVTTLIYANNRKADGVQVLKYANSGDTVGDKTRVVGYTSTVIYKKTPKPPIRDLAKENLKKENKAEVGNMLNKEQRKALLKIARDSMEAYVEVGGVTPVTTDDPVLKKEMGAFVTLHERGQLRGCIGNIYGTQPLYLTIRDMAISSATQDPRFPPVEPKEIKKIEIEISVLSVPKKISNIDEFVLGTHGVIVKRGVNSGVFLPQVATETGWSKEEFLSTLCSQKAGLSPDAWKDKNTELYIFSAEVFSEKSF